MAAVSSGIDPAQCVHYAAFASHLSRKEFDSIYWILFGMVILMLFSASYRYSRFVVPLWRLQTQHVADSPV